VGGARVRGQLAAIMLGKKSWGSKLKSDPYLHYILENSILNNKNLMYSTVVCT
jgi:hypothetical protein